MLQTPTIAFLSRIVFLYRAPGQDFGCVHTQYRHVVLIDFADFQPITSDPRPVLSRLMLCGCLMSATINGLMLPASSEPRTNPSILVTVGSTGKQKHVCTGTHWSSYCLSLFRPSSFLPLLISTAFVLHWIRKNYMEQLMSTADTLCNF